MEDGGAFLDRNFGQAEASEELKQELALLCRSQSLLRTLIFGIALQYRSLDVMRRELLVQAENPAAALSGPTPFALQNAASLIVLCSLFGFQKQTEELAAQAAQAGECPDLLSVKLGATSILIALIRLARLHLSQASAGEASFEAEQEAAALENDPADLSL